MAKGFEEQVGVGQHALGVVPQLGRQPGHRVLHIGPGCLQRLHRRQQGGQGVGIGQTRLQFAVQRGERGAALHHHLAAQQVQRLDAVRAFVDHVQPVVAPELLDGKLARVAVAAQHLDGQRVGLQAPLRGPGLDHRREQLQQQCGVVLLRGVFGGALLVHQAGGVQGQAVGAFHIGFLRQQHASHIGVRHQRQRGRERVFVARYAALLPLAGVAQRGEVPAVAQHDGAHADADARLVHHVEHAGQALVRLAHQLADAGVVLAKGQQGRGGAAPAAFVDQPGQGHVVARAHAALLVGVELGHGEQRDAFDAGRRVGQPRQHQVHDVFAQFVVATGDEDLLALEPVAAVAHRGGAAAQVGQARTGLRLGQRHGAEKAPAAQGLQVARTLLRAAEFLDHVGVGRRQAHIGRGGHVGAAEHRQAGLGHQHRQLQTTGGLVGTGREKAGVGIGPHRGLHPLGQHHPAVHHARLLLVALPVVGGKQLAGDAGGRVEHGLDRFAAVFAVARALQQAGGVQHLVELEFDVASGHQIVVHGIVPGFKCRYYSRLFETVFCTADHGYP